MLKKSSILSCNHFHPLHPSGATSRTSISRTTRYPARPQRYRAYATVSDGHDRHQCDGIPWPDVTSANALPTPYQIFNQKKGSPYSKRRFYELVKLYHPDRHPYGSPADGLSYSTKLERYRLIVAANDILSDPIKRGAYDRYGAGWNGQPDVRTSRNSSDPSAYSGSGWNSPNGPSRNATWEDWEKWYQREADGPQEPRFVSNGTFVFLIVVVAAIGGVGQLSRVENYSVSFLEQRAALHDNISKDLNRKRKETTTAFPSREERINSFLEHRDPYGMLMVRGREESIRRLLQQRDTRSSEDFNTRSSEDIKDRSMDIHNTEENTRDR